MEDLTSLSWYHGSIGREETEEVLSSSETGTYLLRDKTSDKHCAVLSVKSENEVQHFVIVRNKVQQYVLKSTGEIYDSLEDLISQYETTPLFSKRQQTKLVQPLPRCIGLDNIGFTEREQYVNLRPVPRPPESLEFSEPESKRRRLEIPRSKRCMIITIAVSFAVAVLLCIILSISLTICGTGWCKHGFCEESVCKCKDGWQGEFCDKDIDECKLETLVCAGKCINTQGSFKCKCMDGFTLYSDGTSCIAGYLIEMVRIPRAEEVFDPSMYGMEFMIHQGNKMERPTVGSNDTRRRRDVSSLIPDASDMMDVTIHTTDCDLMLMYSLCTLSFQSEPHLCASIDLFISSLLREFSVDFPGQISRFLDKIKVESARFDICDEALEFRAVYDDAIEIIPSFFSLQNIAVDFSAFWPTRVYGIRVSGDWMLGSLRFQLAFDVENDQFEIYGSMSGTTNMDEMVSQSTDSFIPSSQMENAFQQVDLGGVEFSGINLTAKFADFGYAVSIGFGVNLRSLGNVRFYFSIGKSFGSPISVFLAMSLQDLSLSELIEDISNHDISGVPIIGALAFPNAGVAFSTQFIAYHAVSFGSEILDLLPHINKGINLVFETVLIRNVAPITFYVAIWQDLFEFKIIGPVKPFAEDILNLVLDATGIDLPPGIDLAMVLSDTLEGLEYNTHARQLSFPVKLPDRIELIRGILIIDNAMAKFTIGTSSMTSLSNSGGMMVPAQPVSSSGVSFEVEGTWNIFNFRLHTKVKKHPIQGYVAEMSSPVRLSIYDILTGFSAGRPDNAYEKLLEKLGLKDVTIGDPFIRVLLQEYYVIQASGTMMIGKWINLQTEILYSQIHEGIAVGVVTTFGEGMKNIDANGVQKILGTGMLANSQFCIAVATNNFGSVVDDGSFQRFHSPGLSAMRITQGISIALVLTVPRDCDGDNFCELTQNALGIGASIIIQGSLSFQPIRFTLFAALANTRIQILDGVYLTDVGLKLEFQPGRQTIGLTCALQLEDPPLRLTGEIGVSFTGLFIELNVIGFFPLIPTVGVIEIGDIHFETEIGASPVGISYLACGAKIRFGLLDRRNAIPIEAGAYVGIGVNPLSNFFYAFIEKFTVGGVLAAFDFHPNLPDFIADTGFPDGMKISFSATGVVLPSGDVVPIGFRLEGTLSILGFKVMCLIHATPRYLLIDASVSPFKLAGGLIELGGRSDNEGPRLMVDLSWNPPRAPAVLIEGYVSVLGIYALTNVTMNASGMSIYVEGGLWNLFEAHLYLRASTKSWKNAAFEVEAYMQQDLFRVLREGAINALDSYAKAADRAINSAQEKIDGARYHWDRAKLKLENAKQDVENAKQKFLQASAKVRNARISLDSAHASLDRAKSRLSGAQDKVRRDQRKFDDAVNTLRREKQNRCPSKPSKPKWYEAHKWVKYGAICLAREVCKAAFWVAEKAVTAAKGVLNVAIGALEVAKGVVEGARGAIYAAQGVLKAAEVLVAESRHLLDVGKLAIDAAIVVVDKSEVVLDAAIGFLEGVKYANRFGVKILQAIVNVALGGIFDIREIYFSAKLAVLESGHIEARIGISWLGGPVRRYGFRLNLLSISDMVSGLVNVLKELVGANRRRREISYNFFENVGPNTDKFFNNTEDLEFNGCNKHLETGIYSLLEILRHIKSIYVKLEVQENLTFYSQYKQDSLLVLDGSAMSDFNSLENNIDKALSKTSRAKRMLQQQMEQMQESGMSEEMMDQMMDDMSSTMQHLSSGMQHSQNMKDNSVNNFMEELEGNITRDNPPTHSAEIDENMDMVDGFISDVDDDDVMGSIDILQQNEEFYAELENINENDTEAIRRINSSINSFKPMLLNIAKHTEEMKSSHTDMALDFLNMGGMMADNGDMIMEIVERNRDEQMGVNVTNQLMQWFSVDFNRSDEYIDMMESQILIPSQDDTADDEMMMQILTDNLNTPQNEPMSSVDSVEMQMESINGDMNNIMGMMDDVVGRMGRMRSRRDVGNVMDDMQNAMDEISTIHGKLQSSSDMVKEIKHRIMDSSNVLSDLQNNDGVDEDIIRESEDELVDLQAGKSNIDIITGDVIQIQEAGVISWITLLDGNIGLEKNVSLLEFTESLQHAVREHTNGETQDDLVEAITFAKQIFLYAFENDNDDFQLLEVVENGLRILDELAIDKICRNKKDENSGQILAPGYIMALAYTFYTIFNRL